MEVEEVVPAFLAVCPSMAPAWQKHLEFWTDTTERGDYNDAQVIAHHLVDCFNRGDLSEYPSAFALLERCLVDGNEMTKELATIGIIEDIQTISSHHSFGSKVYYDWLGPKSRVAWDELIESWRQVTETKASGLLESPADKPSIPPPDPSQIEDPALRRFMESYYRRS